MAWRIHDSVIRGEIDNRAKGTVRGRIWLAGLPGPVVLELAGNACADLAGCHLRFTNPHPPVPLRPDAVFAEQRGRIGDLTASRKVRVFDVPFAEAYETIQRGGKPPEHWPTACTSNGSARPTAGSSSRAPITASKSRRRPGS